ncbi:MAG: HYR domain-containing protein, partial [Myxococcota bacterium]
MDCTRNSRLHAVMLLMLALVPLDAAALRNRTSFLLDSSGAMMRATEFATVPETCTALNWNGCTASGNPTAAQETCNACMAWTVRVSAGCATNFTSSCRTTYGNCWRFFNGGTGCSAVLGITDIRTRGDGTALTPGCDVNGDGQANDSRLYQAKEALRSVVSTVDGSRFSLWRFAQVEGGQSCTTDAECPDTPGGQSYLTCENVGGANHCMLDAAMLGSANGQCAVETWNGAAASFSCSQCSDAGSERLVCEAYGMGNIRTSGTSPLGGTVQCALPTEDHPYKGSHGARVSAGACDPTGGERLVDFPATDGDDNAPALLTWMDHNWSLGSQDVELVADGNAPIAAALRDMRAAVFDAARQDTATPCRKHQVVLVVGGTEACESVSNAQAAAATFQNMSFTNPEGELVTDYDVPVHVVGFGICPPATPNCQARLGLDAIASAGGTGAAIMVATRAELELTLAALAEFPGATEACNGADDTCDGQTDEDFPTKGQPCTSGVGECAVQGTWVCSGDETGVICSAVPEQPQPELCNGLDDNCDTQIDDGNPEGGQPCTTAFPGPCAAGLTECQSPSLVCNPVVAPGTQPDVPDGEDNDCDGDVDEYAPVFEPVPVDHAVVGEAVTFGVRVQPVPVDDTVEVKAVDVLCTAPIDNVTGVGECTWTPTAPGTYAVYASNVEAGVALDSAPVTLTIYASATTVHLVEPVYARPGVAVDLAAQVLDGAGAPIADASTPGDDAVSFLVDGVSGNADVSFNGVFTWVGAVIGTEGVVDVDLSYSGREFDHAPSTGTGLVVVDGQAPTVSPLPDLQPEAEGPAGAVVNWTVDASDNLGGVASVDCDPPSGSVFAISDTPLAVSCVVSDFSGNTSQEGFTVWVRDTTPPALSLPAGLVVEGGVDGTATVTFQATAVDLVDGSVAVTCNPVSGSAFAAGVNHVDCQATDAAGNVASGQFDIEVTISTSTSSSTSSITSSSSAGGSTGGITGSSSAAASTGGVLSSSAASGSGSTSTGSGGGTGTGSTGSTSSSSGGATSGADTTSSTSSSSSSSSSSGSGASSSTGSASSSSSGGSSSSSGASASSSGG